MSEPLCLVTVHAHPDDESSKGAATVARYHAEGVRTVLVCCTGGEAGEILNPAMDRPDVKERLAEVRMQELAEATAIIGFDEVVLLGYRDSGMPETPFNEDPRCFAKADLDEAIGRLVAVIRRERPQVVITYPDDQQGYRHPDHLRVHDITVPAFEAAGDPDAYPGTGDPWQPRKLYYSAWSQARMRAMHAKFLELGIESPYSEEWMNRPGMDDRITTKIDVSGHHTVRRDALIAHATQIDPTSKFWFGLPPDVVAYPYDDYILARSLVDGPRPDGAGLEDDLFAGLRDPVRQ
jgi:mycothiol S-conjugate amidase